MKKEFLLHRRTVTFVFASFALLFLLFIGEAKAQRGSFVRHYSNLGDNIHYNTGVSTSQFDATIAGFRAAHGDIYENNAGDIIQVYMYEHGGKWHIRGDFRSHKDNESWYVNVLFTSKGLNNLSIGTGGDIKFNHENDRRVYGANRGGSNTVVLDGHWDELEVKGRVIDWTGSNLHIGFQNDHSSHAILFGNGKLGRVEVQGSTNFIVNGGNFGLGTNNPSHKFHVKSNAAVGLFESTDNQAFLRLYTNEGSGNRIELANRQGGRAAIWVGTAGDALNVLKNGNVGIGTTTPGAKLHIVNAAQNSSGNSLILGPTNGANLRLGYHTNYAWIQSHGGKPLYINELGNNTILNKDNGNVGIGTTSTNAKLHVNGDIRVGLLNNTNNNNAAYGNRIHFSGGGDWGKWDSDNSDPLWMARFNAAENRSELRVNLGDDSSYEDKFVVGYTQGNHWRSALTVGANGHVAIGTGSVPAGYTVAIKGKVKAQGVVVDPTNWADYVFEPDYKLRSLKEVKSYIESNGHLPDVPSTKEVEQTGVDVSEMQSTLLRKIEELTLYVLKQQEEIEQLKKQIK